MATAKTTAANKKKKVAPPSKTSVKTNAKAQIEKVAPKKATKPILKSTAKKAPVTPAAKSTPKTNAPKKSSEKSTKTTTAVKPKSAVVPPRKTSSNNMMPYKFQPYEAKASEAYMNTKQLAHFRGILEGWKKDLMQEVDNTITEMKEESVRVLADPNDRATQEEIFNLELRTRDRERKLIRKIEDSLHKIDEKDYGYCESCGIEIGIRRLEARPTAVLCIDCKTLDEIREKQTAQ